MKDFEESRAGIGGDRKASEKLIGLIHDQFEARRSRDPERKFTNEELAQIIDDAKRAGGFDISKKTDPAEIEKTEAEDLRLMAEVQQFLDKVGRHGIGAVWDGD